MSSGIYNSLIGYHNRRSIRLPKYDYSQAGYYFITVCACHRRQNIFSTVANGFTILNEFGKIVENELLMTEKIRPTIKIDTCSIMPDHVHVVIQIRDSHGRGTLPRALSCEINNFQTDTSSCSIPNEIGIPCSNRNQTNAGMMINGLAEIDLMGTSQRAPTNSGTLTTPQFEQFGKPTSNSIPTIIRLIKSAATKKINSMQKSPGKKVWQRGYYEHIVRNEKSLFHIRNYIRNNPRNWKSDDHIDREIDEYEMVEKDTDC